MAPELIPIKLDLTEGSFYTIWAPLWVENDELWEAFLGKEQSLIAFPSIAQLYVYCQQESGHDLYDHPGWQSLKSNPPEHFIPSPAASYPLVDVMAIAVEPPSHHTVTSLGDCLEMCSKIATTCGIDELEDIFRENSILAELNTLAGKFTTKESLDYWVDIQETILHQYDSILDGIDSHVITPHVDDKQVQKVQAELDAIFSADYITPLQDPEIAQAFSESTWGKTGFDPIRINIDNETYYTVRRYVDSKPYFLSPINRTNKIFVTDTPEKLISTLAEHAHDTSLTNLDGFDDVIAASKDDLEVIITPSNDYTFTGLAFEISKGPLKVNPHHLSGAAQLSAEIADYTDKTDVSDYLTPTAPLGWFVEYATATREEQEGRLAPPAPYDQEVSQWEAVLGSIKESFRTHLD